MVVFPNCKINIGLDVVERRTDGFHELSTVMFPVRGLCDSLEIVRSQADDVEFITSGITIECPRQSNICVKAYALMRERFGIEGVRMHLHKSIPFGAGLGGGSADGSFAIRGLNTLFSLGLSPQQMEQLAAELGSDTAFFIKNRPALASGRGEILENISVDLKGLHLLIIKPPFGVSTAQAYSGVVPTIPQTALVDRLKRPITEWRQIIKNDFEEHIFKLYPRLSELKTLMYDAGAIYASMSGSGSAIYGFFDRKPTLPNLTPELFVHQEVIGE